MTISEKVAYIMGLAEGMKIEADTNEGKLTLAMLDVLKDIAEELETVDETLDDMAEIVADIEEQVEELDEELFGGAYDDYDFDEDDLYEITCRKCNNTVAVDMSMLDDGAVNCPNCGEKIEFDIDFINGGCDCGE
ncbi:MAG: hypothetical protein FWG33_01545 [Oscillospiraceae bacterium]|nr:hypothetical protein [Oscillospiraceae bacterium]